MLRRIHSIPGFIAAILVSVLALTGAILSVSPALERARSSIPPAGEVSVADLAANVVAHYPGAERIVRKASGAIVVYYFKSDVPKEAVPPLFALAWAAPTSLGGEAAATALTACGCIALGWLLVSVAPAAWLKLGIYAMAIVDTWFVASNLLQGPNSVLNAAAPAELPRLQAIHFGSALMGFGDVFVAATLGCLLAATRRRQLQAAVLVAMLALAFDLLFFVVDSLPATVPVALALALLELNDRRPTAGRDPLEGAPPR